MMVMGAKDKLKLAVLATACFAGMIALFVLILDFPVRAQIPKVITEHSYDKSPMQLEANYKNPLPIWEAYQSRLEKLPRFSPAPNNHLSQEQIDKFYIVATHCKKKIAEFKQKYLGATQGFGKAMAMAGFADIVLELCLVEGKDMAKIREEEFNWVQNRLFEAALFTLNRKFKSGDYTPEEEEPMNMTREQLCLLLGLWEEKEAKMNFYPEKLKLKNIPRNNIELFLKNKDKVIYSKFRFDKMQFNEQDIMNAAQELAP